MVRGSVAGEIAPPLNLGMLAEEAVKQSPDSGPAVDPAYRAPAISGVRFAITLSKQRLSEFHNAVHKIGYLLTCGFIGFVMVTQVSEIAEMLVESPLREDDSICCF